MAFLQNGTESIGKVCAESFARCSGFQAVDEKRCTVIKRRRRGSTRPTIGLEEKIPVDLFLGTRCSSEI